MKKFKKINCEDATKHHIGNGNLYGDGSGFNIINGDGSQFFVIGNGCFYNKITFCTGYGKYPEAMIIIK